VIEGMARLSVMPESAGVTYNMTDPDPLSTVEVGRLFARLLGKSFAFVPLPLGAAKAAFSVGPLQRFFGMPKETLDYFDHPCRYDASNALRDLGTAGVVCPHLADYAPTLIAFYRKEKERVRRKAMI